MTVTRLNDTVWVCRCGCNTFRYHAVHMLECANCGNRSTEQGEWRNSLPAPPETEPTETIAGTNTVVNYGAAYFASAAIVREVTAWHKSDKLEIIYGAHADGRTRHWLNIGTVADKEHVLRKLREMVTFIEQTEVTDDET
ncbi:hypothetical protein [Rhizobium phage RHph_X2_24]|nr:hypothetical protein [Rhizobium phage RHph_X2_24]